MTFAEHKLEIILKVILFFKHQVQRWWWSHRRAPGWWAGTRSCLAYCLCISRGCPWLRFQTQGCQNWSCQTSHRACEAGASPWESSAHEPSHKHILVSQPSSAEKGQNTTRQPHFQTHNKIQREKTHLTRTPFQSYIWKLSNFLKMTLYMMYSISLFVGIVYFTKIFCVCVCSIKFCSHCVCGDKIHFQKHFKGNNFFLLSCCFFRKPINYMWNK